MGILSIQSHVSYGHAGNSAAVFPLQFLGHEVWPINTVQFSNHTGYGKWTGEVFTAESISHLKQGIFDIADYKDCQAILTGYMGSSQIGDAIVEIVKEVKKYNPKVKYFCDPVMGDIGRGFFVQKGIPEYFKNNIINHADHLSPNHFELEFLCSQKIKTYQELQKASQVLFDKGVSSILVTSFQGEDTKKGEIDIILVRPDSLFKVSTPFLENDYHFIPVGTGDLISSLFLGNYLKNTSYEKAVEKAVSSIYHVIKNTIEKKRHELDIINSRIYFNEVESLFKGEFL